MLDKKRFSDVLNAICETYESQRDFANKSNINRSYISRYIHMKINEPPTPKILKRLAIASKGIISYEELMLICGHMESQQSEVREMVIPRGTDTAKVIPVIETQSIKGAGTEENPVRTVIQYWDFDGNLLAENDNT